MELQNSYIFLKNPHTRDEKNNNNSEDGTLVLTIGKNLYSYIKASFPQIVKVDGYGNIYKKKFAADLQFNNVTCNAEFIITEVVDTKYLDIIVKGKSKSQIVKCLEYIQYTLLTSGIRERYIDIVSYDAVSEYYCNKIYPKLNTLERNLRKLLFNIYIVNFGRDYYKATVGEELQGKIKGVINTDSNKGEKDQIKAEYKTSTKKEAEEIERLQRFFYSFEYNDIQKLLFTPSWTSADEAKKNKFLNEQADLSELSDEELREAFSKYVPRSDWERFFSNKIDISDIKELIEQIRLYRNKVAHFKFFYKNEYDDCNKLTSRLNSAIVKAIKITEDEDFAEKNVEALSESLKDVFAVFANFTKFLAEMTQKAITNFVAPAVTAISKAIEENRWIKSLGKFAVDAVLAEETRKRRELFETVKPSALLTQGFTPLYVSETQSLINSIKSQTTISNIPKINIPKYDIPKFSIDTPQPIILPKIDNYKMDLGINPPSLSTDISVLEDDKDDFQDKDEQDN